MTGALALIAMVAYLAIALIWPMIDLRRRHGVRLIAFDSAAPGQRVFAFLGGAALLAILGAGVLRVICGEALLGVHRAPAGIQALGGLLLIGGAVLSVVAQRQMGASLRVGIDASPTRLVREGSFRYVRNPIFTGLLLTMAGYVCLTPAWWTVALWIAMAVGLRVHIGIEERHLTAMHGEEYLSYAAKVGRLIPYVGRLRRPR